MYGFAAAIFIVALTRIFLLNPRLKVLEFLISRI